MKKHLDEVKKLQKIAGILKENVNQGQASNPKLHAFIKKVYAEIVDDFGGESPISLGQLANYIYDWMKINDLTPDQTIEEFNWRELTYELGLDTPPNVNETRGFSSQELISFLQSKGPKPNGEVPEGEYEVNLAYADYESIPKWYMKNAQEIFTAVVNACGGEAILNGAPSDNQNYTVKGCAFSDIDAMWKFLASDETYSVDTPTTTKANGCAQTWQIEMSGTLKENIGKKITVTTASGTQEYTEADIQDMIDNLDSYMQSDNLPKWMYLASFHNARFPRTKKDILNVLNKILASEKDVYINVKSDQPPQMMTPGVSKK